MVGLYNTKKYVDLKKEKMDVYEVYYDRPTCTYV